jgi:hypothetical protein
MQAAPSKSIKQRKRSSNAAFPSWRATGSVGGRRWVWLLVSGLCFAVATLTAFLQPPRDNPMSPTQTTWDWVKEPIERNPWRRLPAVSDNLSRVFFVDTQHAWIAGDNGTILATRDGGTTWKQQTSGTAEMLESLFFIDASRGWAVGLRGTILATRDGGTTWKPQSSRTSEWLFSVHFADASHGWVVGLAGLILATTDGGVTWTPQVDKEIGI